MISLKFLLIFGVLITTFLVGFLNQDGKGNEKEEEEEPLPPPIIGRPDPLQEALREMIRKRVDEVNEALKKRVKEGDKLIFFGHSFRDEREWYDKLGGKDRCYTFTSPDGELQTFELEIFSDLPIPVGRIRESKGGNRSCVNPEVVPDPLERRTPSRAPQLLLSDNDRETPSSSLE